MKFIHVTLSAALSVSLLSACVAVPDVAVASAIDHPEASPFDMDPNIIAQDDVDAALAEAARTGKHAMIVMGANWCHDSRALAGWFETPRFEAMLQESYSVAYVDVGQKNRNIDVAQRFGLDNIVGTPTVVVTNSQGDVLNLDTAVTWRHSASRTEDEIFSAFEALAQQ